MTTQHTPTPYTPIPQEITIGEHRATVSGIIYGALGEAGPRLTIAQLNRMKIALRPYADAYRNIAPLLAAAKAALEHVEELEEAWLRGALSESDTGGGTRSNRNHDLKMMLQAVIKLAKEDAA